MKNWFWIPLAAIAGLIAGSWGPREDLAAYKESVRAERTQKKASVSAGFDAFAKLANIPDVATRRPKARTNELARSVRHLAPTAGPMTNGEVVAEGRQKGFEKPKNGRQMSREDLRARIEEAADLWNTRVELAKTQWKEKLGVAAGAAGTFDSAIADMNESIRASMQAFADEIERVGKMTPELSLRMMGDVSRTLAETYDALGAAVAPERREEISEMPVFEFIDPTVAEPLVGVQDKLEDGLHARRGL